MNACHDNLVFLESEESAEAVLSPKRRFVVTSGSDRYSLGDTIEAIGLAGLASELVKQ